MSITHYDLASCERRIAEAPKRADAEFGSTTRSEFQRDRARILHSYAFRRLADKTQVVSPGEDDFPRTRLTHSVEVAQIGREMGQALGCDPDIVDAAGLAHDLGHPPFGHNGEEALNLFATSIGGFEGNAQTFRILTRLEAKTVDSDDRPAGLNLTRATLDAVCKYPWRMLDTPAGYVGGPVSASGERPAKFGVYEDDLAAFEWVRSVAPARSAAERPRRCLEAQVMDWADDVAYSVHDVEDGLHAGLIRLADIDEAEREQICTMAASRYSGLAVAELSDVLGTLLLLPPLRDLCASDRSHLGQVAVKRATSELTGRFVSAAVRATREKFGTEPARRYDADLIVPPQAAAECALLKAIAARYVMRGYGLEERQRAQRVLLIELADAVASGAPASLDAGIRTAYEEAGDDAARMRVVVDQIAQLTDSAAIARHTVLCYSR